jgi:hypothetical protein
MWCARASALAAVSMLVLSACEAPAPPAAAVDAAPLRDWVSADDDSRLAQRPQDPRSALTFAVPSGATKAHLAARAIKRADWPPGAREVLLDAEASGGSTTARASGRVVAGAPDSAAWTSLAIDLPAGTASLRLVARGAADVETWWAQPQFEGLAPVGARSLLVVVLEGMRRDAVGTFGQRLSATPNLDALAKRGTRFTQAIAPSPDSDPSLVGAVTGFWPSWSGCLADHCAERRPPLPSLGRVLVDHGWAGVAVVPEGVAPAALSGLSQRLVTRGPPAEAARLAAAWLGERRGRREGEPFVMLWVVPAALGPDVDTRFLGSAVDLPPGLGEEARAAWLLYLGSVGSADDGLGEMIAALEDLDLSSTTDVVAFAPCGRDVADPLARGAPPDAEAACADARVRVPLVIGSPSLEPGRRDEQVSLADLFPTMLALAGLPAPESQGISLLHGGGRAAVAIESLGGGASSVKTRAWREAGMLKLVEVLGAPDDARLFDLAQDPREARDAAARRREDVRRLRTQLAQFMLGAPFAPEPPAPPEPDGLPPGLTDSLRALGYAK